MSKQGRQVGVRTVKQCLMVLNALRRKAVIVVETPEGRQGEWSRLPEDLSQTAFINSTFPAHSITTVRNWIDLLAIAGLYVSIGSVNHRERVVRTDLMLDVTQLAELLNSAGNATQPDEPASDVCAPAVGTDLEMAQTAGTVPVTGSVERQQVTTADMQDVLGQASRAVQLLEELKERRAAMLLLRRQLIEARALNEQLMARVAQLTAELELACSAPTLPADVAEMTARVSSLLDELSAEANTGE